MVEGHSVHRLASAFSTKLVGRRFNASSPNGRFADGALAIDGRVLSRMEAVGKNLFAFFGDGNGEEVVVHGTCRFAFCSVSARPFMISSSFTSFAVHFGMSGAWAMFNSAVEDEPEVKTTTRLRLEEISQIDKNKFITHLSAMTVQHGDLCLYETKKASLGQDPLRSDADPNLLFEKIVKSKKSIGQLIMDQSFFTGPGNIYRAEILFLAGVYPTTPGNELDRSSFDRIWDATVKLLRRGYDTGSILTVDAALDPLVAARGERRYIYNKSTCARCGGRVSSWDMSGRTCYACEGGCQPKMKKLMQASATAKIEVKKKNFNGAKEKKAVKEASKKQHVPFISHCAPMTLQQRLEQGGANQLTVTEIRTVMEQMMSTDNEITLPPKSAKKSVYVEALNNLLSGKVKHNTGNPATSDSLPPPLVSAQDAAREKALSGENRSVEHIAELSREQAVKAIAVTPSPAVATRKKQAGKRVAEIGGGFEANKSKEEAATETRKKKGVGRRRLKYDA